MHDRRHLVLLQHALDERAVGEIALDQRAPLDRPLVPVDEVVEHHGFPPGLGHAFGGLATDVASAADDENGHDLQQLAMRGYLVYPTALMLLKTARSVASVG